MVAARALGGFLAVVGGTHFLVPDYYVRLVPPWLPGARALVVSSGVAEIAIGAALQAGATRRLAAHAAAGLMGVYVLTHVDALLRSSSDRPHLLERPAGAAGRVVVNLGYLTWGLVVARRS